jgi:F-type H+-transporting ATPase subunit b
MSRRLTSLLVLASVSLLSLPALASPEGEGHGGGLTWWSDPFPIGAGGTTGLAWTFINFGILLWILNKLMFIPLRRRTAEKHDAIKGQLEAATKAREEAERIMAEYSDRIGRLDGEIAELMQDATARAETDRERIIAEAEAEGERIKANARAQAGREAQLLQRELEVEIVDKAVTRAEETLRRTFADADQRRLVDGYVTEVQGSQLGGGQ